MDQTPTDSNSTALAWDAGTAYELFVSLHVLHEPEFYELRPSWAAGIRSRIPPIERTFLEEVVPFLNLPLRWVYQLPRPKDARSVFHALKQIEPAGRGIALLDADAGAKLAFGALLEAPASVANAGAIVVGGYSIDSRTVAAGELFFAVRGERLDGHDFVTAALGRGAVAAVVSRERVATLPDAALAVPLLIAEDPLISMQALASHVRRRWGRLLVSITGSAGKTTTKEAVAAALSAKFKVLKSIGNLNNAFGLPLQLLRLEPEHEFAVVEMGMKHALDPGALPARCRLWHF